MFSSVPWQYFLKTTLLATVFAQWGCVTTFVSTTPLFNVMCQQGHGESCFFAGDMYEEEAYGIYDFRLAHATYQRSCAHGHIAGCQLAARNYRYAIGIKQDLKKAYAYTKKACRMGSLTDCRKEAKWARQGIGTTKKTKWAKQRLEHLCQLKDQRSCYALSKANHEPEASRTKRSVARWKSGCDRGNTSDCESLALYQVLYNPETYDRERWTKKLETMCYRKRKTGICRALWRYYKRAGRQEEAQAAIQQGCKIEGIAPKKQCALAIVENHQNKTGRLSKATVARLKRDCIRNVEESCLFLVRLYRQGERVKKDIQKAKQLSLLTCQRTLGASCYDYGIVLLHHDKAYTLAAQHLANTCNRLEHVGACLALAKLYDPKHGQQPNTKQAQIYRQKSHKLLKHYCKLNNTFACKTLEQRPIRVMEQPKVDHTP